MMQQVEGIKDTEVHDAVGWLEGFLYIWRERSMHIVNPIEFHVFLDIASF